jgi:hypothetical protein
MKGEEGRVLRTHGRAMQRSDAFDRIPNNETRILIGEFGREDSEYGECLGRI